MLQPIKPINKKNPMFAFYVGEGGSINNGNGIMNRYIGLYLFRKYYHIVIWRWKIGNGDDGSRTIG